MNAEATSPSVPQIGLIWAEAAGGIIGQDGGMPWHLPEDLAHFKRITHGHPVIMGRRTWNSLPPRFRPLPGRRNIVLTRRAGWQQVGALRAASLDEALAVCADAAQVWVMGGAQVFEQAMPRADVLMVTRVDARYAGDTHAPAVGADWQRTQSTPCTTASGVLLHFETWQRKTKKAQSA